MMYEDEMLELLHQACAKGEVTEVQRLISLGVKIDDAITDQSRTALSCAVFGGHREVCSVLLSHGANPDHFDGDGRTPLTIAAWLGYAEICTLLLSHGADANLTQKDGLIWPPLMLSTYSQRTDTDDDTSVETCTAILDGGANIDQVDELSRTTLMDAVFKGHEEICRLLLKRGANLHLVDIDGRSAMDAAIEGGKQCIVDLLKSWGAVDQTTVEDGMSTSNSVPSDEIERGIPLEDSISAERPLDRPGNRCDDWVFVNASDLVGSMRERAKRADTWWPLISTARHLATPTHAVLVGVTPRNEFMPLLHLVLCDTGIVVDYNPDGLKLGVLSLLVPPSVGQLVTHYLLDLANEMESAADTLARKVIANAQWEAGRTAREAAARRRDRVRQGRIAHLNALAAKYKLTGNDLLDEGDSPTWVFHILERLQTDYSLSQDELTRLRKSSYKYFSAAIHWHAWETAHDPWNVVHACSMLRQVGMPRKAVKLLNLVDTSSWTTAVASAFFTTLGGAQRDSGSLQKARSSAEAALTLRDDKPHPYLLLGALCYQQNKPIEGDRYFSQARERGATEKDIEFTVREAESRRSRADNQE